MRIKGEPLTAKNLPAHLLRRLSPADRAAVERSAAGPVAAVADLAPPRHPPDGWRARINPTPPAMPDGYREHDLQSELVAWTLAEVAAGRLRELALLYAVPNAGAGGSAGMAGKMKAEGVKAGVPDLFLPVPRAGFCGAVLEMKVKPGKVRPEQEKWLDALQAVGHRCAVCYTLAEAKTFLAGYLGGTTCDGLALLKP